ADRARGRRVGGRRREDGLRRCMPRAPGQGVRRVERRRPGRDVPGGGPRAAGADRRARRVPLVSPTIDPGARERLTACLGPEVEAWFHGLPDVLAVLAERWQLAIGAAIPRGSVSVVFRCRTADGASAVLKASPDRARPRFEAAALAGWHTVHSPAV